MALLKGEQHGMPRLGERLRFSKARGGVLMPRSQRARDACSWCAERFNVDEATVIAWVNRQETMPDDVIADLAKRFGFSVPYFMRWDDAPRSTIPERWRQHLAEDAAERCAKIIPRVCERLLDMVEWRLRVDEDLAAGVESSEVPRLQRLRAAVLEFVAEPIEGGVNG